MRQLAAAQSGYPVQKSLLPVAVCCRACLIPGQSCLAFQLGRQPDRQQFLLLDELAALPMTRLQPHLQGRRRNTVPCAHRKQPEAGFKQCCCSLMTARKDTPKRLLSDVILMLDGEHGCEPCFPQCKTFLKLGIQAYAPHATWQVFSSPLHL